MEREGEAQRAAFAEFFCATRTDLLAYLARRCSSPEEAADLLAQTYMIAWQKLELVPPGEGARPWLFGVARKLILKGVSQRHREDALVERLAVELREAQPATGLAEDERHETLRRALATLPETEREIVTLAAWEGLTPKQIASVMGMSANLVRVRLHRARARLRRQLDLPGSARARRRTLPMEGDS